MSDISYTTSLDEISSDKLTGFFVGWPNPPSPDTHLRLLHGSHAIVLALADERVIGFITAISDGVLSAYIPLLEVLPEYKGRGIGSELVNRMLDQLNTFYMTDLLCDDDVAPFYERIGGMTRAGGFMVRHYDAQSGTAS